MVRQHAGQQAATRVTSASIRRSAIAYSRDAARSRRHRCAHPCGAGRGVPGARASSTESRRATYERILRCRWATTRSMRCGKARANPASAMPADDDRNPRRLRARCPDTNRPTAHLHLRPRARGRCGHIRRRARRNRALADLLSGAEARVRYGHRCSQRLGRCRAKPRPDRGALHRSSAAKYVRQVQADGSRSPKGV